ncbi:single-strand selective monofunctional uracil-DNA glycosylase [Opitutaceae bacterium TAV4]|nr:single-strand selective monofunctional uracil-DNA glycosylase [Opitutaceae bacterium TAV4]RRK00678.1 single-strand selective monofunctional uracil-DNA glycosylase [Opitutaceae bacterium TAV3]
MPATHPLVEAADLLRQQLHGARFSAPAAHVYLPLEYAWAPHEQYLRRYGGGRKRVLFLGMNPGPFGMAQTGVPFGEVAAVRDWMGISGPVGRPADEHPKRRIEGFACPKSEVSGRRLWGLFAQKFGTAEAFFHDHFVANYCPLVWMSATGANLTPDKLSSSEIAPVDEVCLAHLAKLIAALRPEWLIGVGGYAEDKLTQAAARLPGFKGKVGRVLHPSPASPAANRGWAEAATRQLTTLGVWST